MSRFRKAHRNAGAHSRRKANEKRRPSILCCESGGENWCQGRDRSIHQARKAGLNPSENKLAARGEVFGAALAIPEVLLNEPVCRDLMSGFCGGEVAEELAC